MATINENLTTLQNTKNSIKNAIVSKGQDLTNVPFTQYAEKINDIQTGIIPTGTIDITENGIYDVTDKASANVNVPSANIVNGIIEQYLSETEIIEANTFVEFVNDNIQTSNTSINSSSAKGVSATSISTNKVFITYAISNNLYGRICNIVGNNITFLNDTLITTTNIKYNTSTIKVNENKVLIAYCNSSDNNLYSIICNISNDTISIGTNVLLSNVSYYGSNFLINLNNNKIFVGFSGNKPSGVICSISENNITVGTVTNLSTKNSNGIFSGDLINNNKIFIAYRSYNLSCILITISNDLIQINIEKYPNYSNLTQYGNITVNAVLENKVFISFVNPNYFLICLIAKISENTFEFGEPYFLLSSIDNVYYDLSYQDHSSILLKNNEINLIFRGKNINNSSIRYTIIILCYIVGATINIKKVLNVDNCTSDTNYYDISIVRLENNKLFSTYNSNYGLKGLIANIENMKIKKSTNFFEGLTKDQITPTSQGDVWVLNN